jgi:hypothetical protein
MIKRTTVSAEDDDLVMLELEARKRQTSLARILRETVAEKARELRGQNRPRFGIGHSAEGAAVVAARDEHAPLRSRNAHS